MAFTPIAQYGEATQTARSSEKAIVQLVELTDDKRPNSPATVRIDLRTQYDRGDGPRNTSTGFGFNDPDEAEQFALAVLQAVEDGRQRGMGVKVNATPVATTPAVPVVKINRAAAQKLAAKRVNGTKTAAAPKTTRRTVTSKAK